MNFNTDNGLSPKQAIEPSIQAEIPSSPFIKAENLCSTNGKFRLIKHFGNNPFTAELIEKTNQLLTNGREQGIEVSEETILQGIISTGREISLVHKYLNENPDNREELRTALNARIESTITDPLYQETSGLNPQDVKENTARIMDSFLDNLAQDPGFTFTEIDEKKPDTQPQKQTLLQTASNLITQVIPNGKLTTDEGAQFSNFSMHTSGGGTNNKGTIPPELATPTSIRIAAGITGIGLEVFATLTTFYQNKPAGIEAIQRINPLLADVFRGSFSLMIQTGEFFSVFLMADLINRFQAANTVKNKIYYGIGIAAALGFLIGGTAFDLYSSYNQAATIGFGDQYVKWLFTIFGITAPFLLNIARGGAMGHEAQSQGRPLQPRPLQPNTSFPRQQQTPSPISREGNGKSILQDFIRKQYASLSAEDKPDFEDDIANLSTMSMSDLIDLKNRLNKCIDTTE